MKTLIIHPKDSTTDFLSVFYQNIPDKVVISGGVSKDELREMIKGFDRVIMCGHGTPNGLLTVGQFKSNNWGYIIDETFVDVLSEKTENIFIWCNSDKFVRQHNLKGFFSGMFISEVGESEYCGVPSTQDIVTESNDTFSNILSKYINDNVSVIHEQVTKEYGKFSQTNPIGYYNNKRLYLTQ
jgi:hypothetical protein